MLAATALLSAALFGPPAEVESKFVQSYPLRPEPAAFFRSPRQPCAVVLIHGLAITLSSAKAREAKIADWQESGPLVRALSENADVYAFAYGQNVPVDRIAHVPTLRQGVARLKRMGYLEVILLGHSAGGIVARQFVEDYPEAGVTKVLQICAPNGGSLFARLNLVAPAQRQFVASLTEASRKQAAQERDGRMLPPGVQCLCVVGFGAGSGDAVVSCKCQWPEDLQAQGVPVARLKVLHWVVMGCPECGRTLAEYARQQHPRWTADQVGEAQGLLRLLRPSKGK